MLTIIKSQIFKTRNLILETWYKFRLLEVIATDKLKGWYKFSHQGTKAQRRDINLTLCKKGIYARYRAYERNANTLSFKIFRQTF